MGRVILPGSGMLGRVGYLDRYARDGGRDVRVFGLQELAGYAEDVELDLVGALQTAVEEAREFGVDLIENHLRDGAGSDAGRYFGCEIEVRDSYGHQRSGGVEGLIRLAGRKEACDFREKRL